MFIALNIIHVIRTRLDCFLNEDVGQEVNAISTTENIDNYRKCWREHLLRMDEPRISKVSVEYNPKRRKDVGRP